MLPGLFIFVDEQLMQSSKRVSHLNLEEQDVLVLVFKTPDSIEYDLEHGKRLNFGLERERRQTGQLDV